MGLGRVGENYKLGVRDDFLTSDGYLWMDALILITIGVLVCFVVGIRVAPGGRYEEGKGKAIPVHPGKKRLNMDFLPDCTGLALSLPFLYGACCNAYPHNIHSNNITDDLVPCLVEYISTNLRQHNTMLLSPALQIPRRLRGTALASLELVASLAI